MSGMSNQNKKLLKENQVLKKQIIELKAVDANRLEAEKLLSVQRDIAVSLGSTNALTDVLDQILEATFRTNGIDCGGVHLADKERGGFTLVSHKRLSRRFIDRISFYAADSPQAIQAKSGKPIYGFYPDIFLVSDEELKKENLCGAAIVPVDYLGELVAILNLVSKTYDEIPGNTRTAVEAIAAQIGGVITRVRVEEERERLIKELKDALEKVKTLSGLLPICANCKSIRDDQGYWHQVEEYLLEHADVLFSHGICDKCVKKLYPDLMSEND